MMFDDLGTVLTSTSLVALATGITAVATSRFRIVVSTNDVHIVQHANKTVAYGKDQDGGNVYYRWPAWIPRIGVRTTSLPSSVFQLSLKDYPAYDKGRVPFVLDVIGFFRILDFASASARVSDIKDLQNQLDGILKGAMRAILASFEIEEILEGRSQFGERFTQEVDKQLTQWGVTSVKAVELMDIRDSEGSKVISNIMAKKKSFIERQSRVEVAENLRAAEVAEIEAKQNIEIRGREQEEAVGQRSADRDKNIGISQQQALQAVAEENANTITKQKAVEQIAAVRNAEISRAAAIVAADQSKQVTIISAEAERNQKTIAAEAQKQVNITTAEGNKQNTILVAEGNLASQKMSADARRATGEAEGAAQQAVLMAPVNSQIALAKEIGENQGYQQYLITVRQIDAGQVVGVEAAKSLSAGEVKIIATTGSPMEGVKSVMDLMTPKGATQLGASLEALANTDIGKRITGLLNGSEAR